MHVAIVYESLFGNTRQIAEAIGEGVRQSHPGADVDCLQVQEANPDLVESADLLVVGGPTHMRGMTSRMSRKAGLHAIEKEADELKSHHEPEEGAEGPGVREWFRRLPKTHDKLHAAAFDTRAAAPMSGGAARGIARKLRHHGYELVSEPQGFVIEDAEGPLRDGELARAKAWGAALN
ncbi:flavodoxin family protein [Yinghuangia seranimata]|uniref:flavodoxin family protein n=1 Tax=Yinghuangia seranimata TaxID=408067 RepID=UPI00248B0999|nr:flavodoxin domain-containing protein [Yinghuangia seranimata]MDI2124803.1 flavodoxin domain-containing protein [Yinghuangia seranimata]